MMSTVQFLFAVPWCQYPEPWAIHCPTVTFVPTNGFLATRLAHELVWPNIQTRRWEHSLLELPDGHITASGMYNRLALGSRPFTP